MPATRQSVELNSLLLVSEVEIMPVKPRGGLVGFASCVINNQLYLGNIGIHTKPDGNGFRLTFPIKVLPSGKEIHCFHPVTKEAGLLLHQAIIERFEALMANIQRGDDVATTSRQPGGSNGDTARIP